MTWTLTFWIGVFLLAIAGFLAVREHLWLRQAKVAPGTVVELIATRSSKGGSTYKPRVQFTAHDGSQHEFVRDYATRPAGFSVGESVAVAYQVESDDARILTFGQRFGFAAIFAVLGFACVVISLIFIVGRQLVPRIYLS